MSTMSAIREMVKHNDLGIREFEKLASEEVARALGFLVRAYGTEEAYLELLRWDGEGKRYVYATRPAEFHYLKLWNLTQDLVSEIVRDAFEEKVRDAGKV